MSAFQRRSLAALMALLLALSLPLSAIAEETLPPPSAPPSVSAQAAVLMEAQSGEVAFAHNADARLPMASTTKIMTALTALTLAKPQDCITVDASAVGVEGSSVYLVEGEVLTLEQLLYALLLESANDAAVAIAVGICGSVDAFADEMNRIAAELGLCDTHFTNPHGLDHEEHYTTARELAIITGRALQNELFAAIVATRKTTIPHPDAELGARLLINHNKLLRLNEDCIGVKTGFTKRSGRCLVSAARRDGVELIAVTLNAPDDWDDHTAMLNYGFSQYRSVQLYGKGEYQAQMPLVGGVDGYVTVTNTEALCVTLRVGARTLPITVEGARFAYAPVLVGEELGRMVLRCDRDGDGVLEVVAESRLTAAYDAPRAVKKASFWEWLKSLFLK